MIKFRVKQEPPTIDDNLLVKAVRENIFLYDHKHADYRNLPMRATVWAKITDTLKVNDRKLLK